MTTIHLNADNPMTVEVALTLPENITNRHTAYRWLRWQGYDLTDGAKRIVQRVIRSRASGDLSGKRLRKQEQRRREQRKAIER